MNEELFRRTKELFLQCLDAPVDDRASLLDDACGTDEELRAEVERMLDEHDQVGDFLEVPPSVVFADPGSASSGHRPPELLPEELPRVVAGRYELTKRIGAGGFGAVYHAKDLLTEQPVAVKLLPEMSPFELSLLRREISAQRLLRPAGVARLFDEGVDENGLFLAMELVEGRPFPGRPATGSWEDVRDVSLALLETIARVHTVGVVHRDLKPANVLVDAGGRPVLLDFGLSAGAAIAPDLSGALAGLGTPAYCAPEQLRGEQPDARSDLYSFGVMAFEALAGRGPHEAENINALINARLTEPPTPITELVPDAPPHVADTLAKLLAPDPADRPRSAVEALHLLRGEDAPVQAHALVREVAAGYEDAPGASFTEDDLRSLFAGPDRLFHLREDAARELFLRTDGDPARVAEELDAWVRAGLGRSSGEEIAVDRASLERLHAGLRVVPPRPRAGDAADLGEAQEELLAWITLAWPRTEPERLARLSEAEPDEIDRRLAMLERAGAIRRRRDGRAEPLVTSPVFDGAGDEKRQELHGRVAAALAPGTLGRLYHLTAAGKLDEVAPEAIDAAGAMANEGRLAEAEVLLAEGLHTLRRQADGDGEAALLAEWCRIALMEFTPRALDRVMYELSRTARRGDATDRMEELVRAAVSMHETDADRALARAEAIEPFDDPELDRLRQRVRVNAARHSTVEEQERVLADIEGWAETQRDRHIEGSLAEVRGLLCYRQRRYEAAADEHARAAELYERIPSRLSALLNRASSLLEAFRPDEAREVAEEARALAARCRHPFFEGRATWLGRAARYRAGAELAADDELIEAVRGIGNLDLEGMVCRLESAIAWRAGDREAARSLAAEAQRCWHAIGSAWSTLLCRALALAAGAEPAEGEVAELAGRATSCPYPRMAAEMLGLLTRAGAEPTPAWNDVLERVRKTVPRASWSVRMHVLAVSELPCETP